LTINALPLGNRITSFRLRNKIPRWRPISARCKTSSYVARVIRLTLLAPDIVEAILDGRNADLTLDVLLKPFPLDWKAQMRFLNDECGVD
jgi:hypothetical protein